MIKFKLKQLWAEKEFQDKCKIRYNDIQKKTGISRMTLSRIADSSSTEYHTSTKNIDKLCTYFKCNISDILEYIPD